MPTMREALASTGRFPTGWPRNRSHTGSSSRQKRSHLYPISARRRHISCLLASPGVSSWPWQSSTASSCHRSFSLSREAARTLVDVSDAILIVAEHSNRRNTIGAR